MAEYRVTWTTDIEADSHELAAQQAQEQQQTHRPAYWSGVFEVQERVNKEGLNQLEKRVLIDLDADGEPYSKQALKTPELDFEVQFLGSITRLRPITSAARDWLADNVDTDGWQWMGPYLCGDAKPVSNLLDILKEEGFEL